MQATRHRASSNGLLVSRFKIAAMRSALVLPLFILAASAVSAQRVPDPNYGNPQLTQWGVLDGNRVRTLYANHGEIARHPDQPSAEWPKGSGHSYIDGIAFIVSAAARDANGNLITPMSTNYREFIDRDPVTRVPWGWAPLPGYSNPRQSDHDDHRHQPRYSGNRRDLDLRGNRHRPEQPSRD